MTRRWRAEPGTAVTARELEVLRLVARGLADAGIARELGLSINTVRNHVKRVMSRLGASSRTHAVVRGQEAGLLSSPSADVVRAARPVLASYPRCRVHAAVAPGCGACGRWAAARQVLAAADEALLAVGRG